MTAATLDIAGISKRYGDVVALDGVTLDVRAGELFGFVGGNGAGKSTTMRIVLGVVRADSGEVRWNGRPVTFTDRRRIGYMPEERGLYPRMRVADQLVHLARLHGLTPAAARSACDDLLERLGLTARRRDEVQKLSLGNQQRVQLAAALVHRPELLVLDEPFSGLDPIAVEVMAGLLAEECARGVPVIFSSHQLDLVERLCDRVGVIRAGRMVAVGTVDELRGGSARRLVVDAPDAPAGWADAVPGARVVEFDRGRTVLELDATADDQALLRTALATGPVRELTPVRPRLTEIFHDLVVREDHEPVTREEAA